MPETTILTHGDCDGICAAAVALTRYPESRVYFSKPVSLFRDLNQVDTGRIIITDIAISRNDAVKIINLLKKKSEKSEILYFDHHVFSDRRLHQKVKGMVSHYGFEPGASSSEIIYKYFMKDIPPERVWCALYGAIGDYTEDTPFVEKMMKDWDMRAIYFEVSSLVMGIKNEHFGTYDMKRKLVTLLSLGRNPSDMDGLVREAKLAVNREFELYDLVKRNAKVFGNIGYIKDVHHFGFRGPAALFSATVTDKPVGMSVYTHQDYTDITLRTRKYRLNLGAMAEKAAKKVGGSGGGHPHAAGARIGHSTLKEFVKELDRVVGIKIKQKNPI